MARPITPDDLLSFRLAGEPQLSPDGRRLAYVEARIDKEKNTYRRQIFMMDATPGARPVPFTAGTGSDRSLRWSPDGTRLAFVSDRSGHDQIWVIDAAGGEARQLTRFKDGIGGTPVWSPDSRFIAFTASVGADGPGREGDKDDESDLFKKYTRGVKRISRIAYKLDGQGFLETEKHSQVFVIPAEADEGEATARPVTRGPWNHSAPAFSPDGRSLAFVANRREDDDYTAFIQDLWLQDLTQPEAEPVRLTDSSFALGSPAFSPDGTKIAFMGHPWQPLHGYSSERLYAVNVDGSGLTRVDRDWDRTFGAQVIYDMPAPGGSGGVIWTPDGAALIALTSDSGRQQVVAVDLESGSVTLLTAGDHCITSWSFDRGCRKMAVGLTRPDLPADLFLVEGPDLLRLTHVNDALLAEVELAAVEPFTFAAGLDRADGWVMKPVGFDPSRQYPAVLEIHGGPMGMYGWTFFMEFQMLAAAGYAVVYTNPRGSQGYSEQFCACIRADWGNLDYQDVMAGLDAALTQFPWLDAQRLGVAGGSYGGFMTNWIVGHTDRFKAAVTMRSVVNEASSVGTSDFGFVDMLSYPTKPWEDMTFYRGVSPLTFVANITTPLLIEHQENDHRCPIEQAEQLYTALKVLKRTVEFVRYPESSHGMSRTGKPWLRVYRLRTIRDWFDRYIPQA